MIEEVSRETVDSTKNIIRMMLICHAKSKDGLVTRFKVQLVARGDTQRPFADYQEDTYVPTSRIQDIRLLCGVAVQRKISMFTFDVETAFLNAPIDKELYITMPSGFNDRANDGFPRVYKLHKALYGLKQSPQLWFNYFHNLLTTQLGFESIVQNETVLQRSSGES